MCLENAKSDWNVSIIAVCDQQDKEQTVLLGTNIESDWHKTIFVRNQESKVISQIKADCSDFVKEHLRMSSAKAHEVCTYT